MKIDLGRENLFEANELDLSKNINFIFGKNGTGKSTITNLIKMQCTDVDVKVFQGFEGLLDNNNRLNAVLLGEENNAINHEIDSLRGSIKDEEKEQKEIEKRIKEPEDGSENLWTQREARQKELKKREKELETFYTSSAATIKTQDSPQIASPRYNKRDIKEEISNAVLLSDIEKHECEELLKIDAKEAAEIEFPQADFALILDRVNAILQKRVEEKIRIQRIENDNNKRNFAQEGIRIHRKGDICAFCGNTIDDSVLLN